MISCTCPDLKGYTHRDECPMTTGIDPEPATVELTGWQPALHNALKAAVGKHVTLHVGVGLAITGTLTSYDEESGEVTVLDRDTNVVAAGSVAVLVLRGTAR